jgi:hypothetical protein
MTFRNHIDDAMQHQDREGEEVKACQCLWQSFVVTRQAAEARRPSETALNGLITNDKFCWIRTGRLQLSYRRGRARAVDPSR